MLLTEIYTAVRTATRVPATSLSDAELLVWINEGLYRVATYDHRWRWLQGADSFVTVEDQQNYPIATDIASDVERITAVYSNTKRTRLQEVHPSTVLELYGGDMPEGANADTFYLWENDLWLLPVPDTADIQYNVYYHKSPTALATLGFADTLDEVGNIDDSQTAFTVDNGAGWPSTPFTVVVGTERMRVTDVTVDEFTVTRGYDGTTAATALDGAAITLYADRPEWAIQFHSLLAYYCEMRVWMHEEELEKAQAAEIQYMRLLRDMETWYKDQADDHPWAVGVPQRGRGGRSAPRSSMASRGFRA